MERAILKAKVPKVAIAGIRLQRRGTLIGTIGANITTLDNHSGTPPPKERVKEKIRVNWTRALYGVTFIKDLVIQPIGASITLIVQVILHLTPMVLGVRLVIASATPPILVLHPLFAFLLKEKESGGVVRATMGIEYGKAKTSPQVTILTKLLQLFTKNPLLPLPQAGETILN